MNKRKVQLLTKSPGLAKNAKEKSLTGEEPAGCSLVGKQAPGATDEFDDSRYQILDLAFGKLINR